MPRGGDVKQIKDLFAIYKKKLIAPEKTVIECFIAVVDDVLGLPIKATQVSYTPHSKTLTFIGSGVIKQEVLLNKTELLSHMQGRLGVKSAPTTIF